MDVDTTPSYSKDDHSQMSDSSGDSQRPPKPKKGKHKENDTNLDFSPENLKNELFSEFYSEIVPTEEFDSFLSTLKTELPTTFRICASRGDVAFSVNHQVQCLAEEVQTLRAKETEINGAPLKQIDWYPGGLAWQMDVGSHKLKKNETEAGKKIRSFIVRHNQIGNISRQEAVSMVPPLFMDVKEHHRVLDMCAAPGSKTAQLIEMIHQDAPESYNELYKTHAFNHNNPSQHKVQETAQSLPAYDGLVRGFVLANDRSHKRCQTLITQTKRLNSPGLIVTQSDAQILPLVYQTKLAAPSSSSLNASESTTADLSKFDAEPILFDRILCDVPCSGDGTLRKNLDIWWRWSPYEGQALHILQLKILLHAFRLSAPGARIVYSTCSMNPTEDEAVISAALTSSAGKMRLVDVSHLLPKLKRRQGMHSWRIMDAQKNWYTKFEEIPESLQKKIHKSSFPPTPEVAQNQHLEYCMRYLPHDQNTGGFFVAVLECNPDFITPENSSQSTKKNYKKKTNNDKARTPKWTIFDDKAIQNIWKPTADFLGVKDNFPTHQLVWHGTGQRRIFFVSDTAATILKHDVNAKLRVDAVGVRLMEKMTHNHYCPTPYRLTQDGISSLLPFLSDKRVVEVTRADFLKLLGESEKKDIREGGINMQPEHEAFEANNNEEGEEDDTKKQSEDEDAHKFDIKFEEFSKDAGEKLKAMPAGPVVYSYNLKPSNHTYTSHTNNLPTQKLFAVAWRGTVSSHVLLKDNEKRIILDAIAQFSTP